MPWIYPPFGQVLLYLIYRVGGYAALSWLSALACMGVVAYLIRKRTMPSLVLAMLAIPAIAYRTAPRSDLFSTVLFAVLLGELWAFHYGERRHLWLVPAVMLVWVNVHPGFIAGLAVIAAYVVFEAGDLLFEAKRTPALRRLTEAWPWLVAGVAATFINPWGLGIYRAALNLAGVFGPAPGSLNSGSSSSIVHLSGSGGRLVRQRPPPRHLAAGEMKSWRKASAIRARTAHARGDAQWQRKQSSPAAARRNPEAGGSAANAFLR
jgi:hypothetical protein